MSVLIFSHDEYSYNKLPRTRVPKKICTYCSYEGQSLVVNEIFPPCQCDDDDDDDDDVGDDLSDCDDARYDRSDASRTADEGVTTDDEADDDEIQFKIDDKLPKPRYLSIQID